MDHVAIDFAGPFPATDDGFQHCLLIVDCSTRFCFLHATKTWEATEVAKCLLTTFSLFGFSRVLSSDNANGFVSKLLQAFFELSTIGHRVITPYYPQANGLAESHVKIFKTTLNKSLSGKITQLANHLHHVQFAMNSRISNYHGSTPFSLMFARKMNPFRNYKNDEPIMHLTEEEFKNRLQTIENTVLPALSSHTQVTQDARRKKFNETHRLVASNKTKPENQN